VVLWLPPHAVNVLPATHNIMCLGTGLIMCNSPQLECVGDAFPATDMVLSLDTKIIILLQNVPSVAEDTQIALKSVKALKILILIHLNQSIFKMLSQHFIINNQRYAALSSLIYYSLRDYATCLGCPLHPSSGVHKNCRCSHRYKSCVGVV